MGCCPHPSVSGGERGREREMGWMDRAADGTLPSPAGTDPLIKSSIVFSLIPSSQWWGSSHHNMHMTHTDAAPVRATGSALHMECVCARCWNKEKKKCCHVACPPLQDQRWRTARSEKMSAPYTDYSLNEFCWICMLITVQIALL